MAEDSYIDVARQRRTVNKLKELIDKKADVDSIASDVFVINLDTENMTADKTYQEILNAYNAGKYLLLRTSEGRTALWDFSYSWGFSFSDYSRRSWSSLSSDSEAIGLNKYTEYQLTTQNKWTRSSAGYQTWKGSLDVFDIKGLNHIVTLKDSAITTAKLADGSVTKAKLGSDVVIPETYTLPVADPMTLGGVRVSQKLSEEIDTSDMLSSCFVTNSKGMLIFAPNNINESTESFNFKNGVNLTRWSDDTLGIRNASKTAPGVIKVGDGLSVTGDGTLRIANGAITADKLASGVGDTIYGYATVMPGAAHTFGNWEVIATATPLSGRLQGITVYCFYNDNMIEIVEARATGNCTKISLTISHTSGCSLNRSGGILVDDIKDITIVPSNENLLDAEAVVSIDSSKTRAMTTTGIVFSKYANNN